jgi:hypothetical protein
MPLTQIQIELAEADEDTRRDVYIVHSFLKANKHLAYTPDEVAEAVHQDPHLVAHMLEKFDDLDLVERRFINGERYFWYREDLPGVD